MKNLPNIRLRTRNPLSNGHSSPVKHPGKCFRYTSLMIYEIKVKQYLSLISTTKLCHENCNSNINNMLNFTLRLLSRQNDSGNSRQPTGRLSIRPLSEDHTRP